MPYDGQGGSKISHHEVLESASVKSFLSRCSEVPKPSAEEIAENFQGIPAASETNGELRDLLIALDGSLIEVPVDEDYPSRKLGFIKISSVLLKTSEYEALKDSPNPFPDPFEVQQTINNCESFSLALPGAYVQPEGCKSPKHGFRKELFDFFKSDETRIFGDDSPALYDTLVDLLSLLAGLGSVENLDGNRVVRFSKCPDCGYEEEGRTINVGTSPGHDRCPECEVDIFVTDSLRLHEKFEDEGNNSDPYGRSMNLFEHVYMIHALREIHRHQPADASKFCFLIDGPLSINGEPARIHSAIMRDYYRISSDLILRNLKPPLVFGLTKTGRVVEHFREIDDLLPPDRLFLISDEYRYKYIDPSKRGSTAAFGNRTYYGQDFLFKTAKGSSFVLNLAYPFERKTNCKDFENHRFDINKYINLWDAVETVRTFETELFQDSVIPVVLAHNNASLSRDPGGKALSIAAAVQMGN